MLNNLVDVEAEAKLVEGCEGKVAKLVLEGGEGQVVVMSISVSLKINSLNRLTLLCNFRFSMSLSSSVAESGAMHSSIEGDKMSFEVPVSRPKIFLS